MKIYLDDERTPPEGWILARSVPVLCHLLQTHKVTHLSLDHDLGEDEMTGYDFMLWLEAQVFNRTVKEIPEITFHTANPTGRRNMELALSSIKKRLSAIAMAQPSKPRIDYRREASMDKRRRIVYDFFELSFPTRMKLISTLGFLCDEDTDATDPELIRRVVLRASESNRLDELHVAISKELAKTK